MKKYHIDIKVYETTPAYAVPYVFPATMLSEGDIKIGYHSIVSNSTEEQVDELCEWAATQSALKIIGVTKLN